LTFSVLSFIVIVIGLLFLVFPGWLETVKTAVSGKGMLTASSGGLLDGLKVFAVLGGALSPDIFLLIGFMSDLMNMKFRYSVTSLLGVIAVILHWGVAGMVYGFTPGSTSAVSQVAESIQKAAETVIPAATPSAPGSAPAPAQVLGVGTDPSNPSPPAGILDTLANDREFAQARADALERRSARSSPSTLNLNDTQSQAQARRTRRAAERSTAATQRMAATGTLGRTGRNPRTGGSQLPDYIAEKFNPCAIRGLGYFDIKGSPMGLAALSAIFMVYLLDMTAGKKRSSTQVGGYIGFSAIVYMLNVYAYREFKCLTDPTVGGILKASLLPCAIGLGVGGIGYSVIKSHYADFLPLDPEKFDTTGAPASGSGSGGNQPSCSAPNDQDQMVCEAYQNGKRVSSIVAA
jgi:hypothetical protein